MSLSALPWAFPAKLLCFLLLKGNVKRYWLTIVPSPLMRAAVWGRRFTPKKILLSILSKQQKKKGY